MALGSGGLSEALQSGVNIPILAVLGLFAGLFSWQMLEMIQSKGEAWLAGVERRDLRATGLLRALEAKNQTPESCAQHVGYTVAQIDRWTELKDKVTPELQDRVSTWLGVKRGGIFSTLAPRGASLDRSMFAIGLKPYLQRVDAKYDEESIAKALRVSRDVVERWRDQKLAVNSDSQWMLVELLGERYADFYEARPNQVQYWAVGWRSIVLPAQLRTADQVAAELGVAGALVRDWPDLEQPVPAKTTETLIELFDDAPEKLFDREFDRSGNRFRAKKQALTGAILACYGAAGNVSLMPAPRAATASDPTASQQVAIAGFAADIDVPTAKVEAWLAGEQRLYRPTCEAISRLLAEPPDALFEKVS